MAAVRTVDGLLAPLNACEPASKLKSHEQSTEIILNPPPCSIHIFVSALIAKWPRHAAAHARSGVWAIADQGINPLLQLILTPYFVAQLGKADFAIWILANALLSLSQLVSFGAGIATTKHVSADLAIGSTEDAAKIIRAALSIALVGGGLATVLTFTAATRIAGTFFLQIGDLQHMTPIIALSGLSAAIQEVDNVYASALRGAERFDLAARIEVPYRVGMFAVLALFAWRNPNIEEMYIVLLAMMVVKALLKAFQTSVLLRNSSCLLPSMSPVVVRRVLHFGLWQWLQSAGTVLFSTTDQLIIGSLIGAEALTRYGICLQLAQYVHLIPSVMLQVIFPRVSAMSASLDAQRGNQILRSATFVATGIALVLAAAIATLAYPLLRIWMGADFASKNYWLLIVLVGAHLILAINIGAYFVLLGSGRASKSAGIVLAAGAAQAALAVLLAPLGVLAVACSRFLYASATIVLYRVARFDARVPSTS